MPEGMLKKAAQRKLARLQMRESSLVQTAMHSDRKRFAQFQSAIHARGTQRVGMRNAGQQ